MLLDVPIRPERAVADLRKVVPAEGIVLADVGIHYNWLVAEWDAWKTRTFLTRPRCAQLPVLLLQRPQPPRLADFQPAVLRLSAIQAPARDTVPPAQFAVVKVPRPDVSQSLRFGKNLPSWIHKNELVSVNTIKVDTSPFCIAWSFSCSTWRTSSSISGFVWLLPVPWARAHHRNRQ
jgi:hypothetical protein